MAVLGAFFLLPLVAMVEFTTRAPSGSGRTLDVWRTLADVRGLADAYPDLVDGLVASAWLVVLTVGLMLLLLVPTMIWVRLRVPRAKKLIEFLCLLPLTIPALVIVVGMRNVYAWVDYLVGDSALTLTFVYVVLVLPYSYRAIDAALGSLDATTLSEAARSLGAGWFTVITRVILPNIWPGVLSAAFIAVALVLGEYVAASLLHFDTLPVAMADIYRSNGPAAMAAALATMVVVSTLLLGLTFLSRDRHKQGASS